MKSYTYGILKYNNETFARESTLLDNDYKPVKYALIEKIIIPWTQEGGNEAINRIIYSDDLEKLSLDLQKYITWCNHPIGLTKNIQGYLRELP